MKKFVNWIFSLLLFFAIWQIVSSILNNPLFPSPIEVIISLYLLFAQGVIFDHIISSLIRVLMGFSVSLLFASTAGFIIGMSPIFNRLATPIIEILRPIPPIAWIPLSIVWFGLGDASASFIIFIAAFFPIFTNVVFGVESLPRIYKRISKNYRLGIFHKFIHVIFPFTLPYLLNGIKTSMGIAWMAVIGAEIIASNRGLGYFIEINRVLLNINNVIATMIVIGVIGFLLVNLFSFLESKIVYWEKNNE